MRNVLEIVTYNIKQGIETADYLKSSKEVGEQFIMKQKGFIKHTLARSKGNEWVDVIHWNSMEDATKASEAAMQSPVCAPMFGMIDEASIKMSHFEIQN
jgi:heme-degrading monooxygenase HmoA